MPALSSDDEGAPAAALQGEPWVAALATAEYDSLPLSQRLAALDWLLHQALGMPTLRAEIDWRTDEAQAARRQMQEEARVGGAGAAGPGWAGWLRPPMLAAGRWPGPWARRACASLHL
jgi:hypothetical protein